MPAGFHELRVAELRRETEDAVSIRFDVPEDLRPAFAFLPGQHLTLRAEIDGAEARRTYSVCVAPHEGELRIAVKEISGGTFSGYVNRRLRAGDVIDVMPPRGSFTWRFDPAATRRYVAFAGGSGITPVLSLLKTALTVEPRGRFTLVYGNRSAASAMFLDALAEAKDRYMARLDLIHVLEDEAEFALLAGRLDAEKIGALCEGLVRPETADAVFVCGPGPMMDAAEAVLRGRGVPGERILIERFTASAPARTMVAAPISVAMPRGAVSVTVVLDGRRARVDFDPALGNVLDSARAAGVQVPFACKAGVCATCRARIVSGAAEMKANYALREEEVARGYVLTCQAVPRGEGLVVDYDG